MPYFHIHNAKETSPRSLGLVARMHQGNNSPAADVQLVLSDTSASSTIMVKIEPMEGVGAVGGKRATRGGAAPRLSPSSAPLPPRTLYPPLQPYRK
jgi:hypothetical protein